MWIFVNKAGWRRVAVLGMMTAIALTLSYLEGLVPLPIPGVKLGLANLVTLLLLYRGRAWEALLVLSVRILLVSLLFGSLLSLYYSLLGAVFSFPVMLLLKKTGALSPIGVSIGGAVLHNLGQLTAAVSVLGSNMLLYLPLLLIGGALTGCVVGVLSRLLLQRIPLR